MKKGLVLLANFLYLGLMIGLLVVIFYDFSNREYTLLGGIGYFLLVAGLLFNWVRFDLYFLRKRQNPR